MPVALSSCEISCHNGQYRLKHYDDGLRFFTEVHGMPGSGNITDVREMASKSRNQRVILLNEQHKEVVDSTEMLATAYWLVGRWEEAGKLEMQVIETRKTSFGDDHPSTLSSMANLASTYWNQGRWYEAEQLEVQVMKIRRTKLGEDRPDTLTSMASLAFTWKSFGHDTEAIDLLRNCLAKQNQILGLNHPITLFNSETLLLWETEVLGVNA